MSLSQKITQLKQNLLTCINSLKTILISKGVEITDTDTLTTLVQKVDTIEASLQDEETEQLLLEYGYQDCIIPEEEGYNKTMKIVKDAIVNSYNASQSRDRFDNIASYNRKTELVFLPSSMIAKTSRYYLDGATNVKYLPILDCSKVNNYFFAFNGLRQLEEVHLINCDLGKPIATGSFNGMFKDCEKLKKITGLAGKPAVNISGLFRYCCLLDVPYIDTSEAPEMNQYFPLGPNAIQETFPEIDFSGATTDTITLADGSNANNKLYAKNMSFAGTIYKNIQMVGDNFTRETMLDLFEHLADYSDGDAHTVQLGSVSLARLSDEDKAIAINKNWTLS